MRLGHGKAPCARQAAARRMGRAQSFLFRDRIILQLLCNNPSAFVEAMKKIAAGQQLRITPVDANSEDLGSISFEDVAPSAPGGQDVAAAPATQGLIHRTMSSLSPGELVGTMAFLKCPLTYTAMLACFRLLLLSFRLAM